MYPTSVNLGSDESGLGLKGLNEARRERRRRAAAGVGANWRQTSRFAKSMGLALVAVIAAWPGTSLAGGPCACNADVEPCGGGDGVINIADVLFLTQCVEMQMNPCGGPLLDCDVNCDGIVDFADVGAAILQFQNIPDACNLPVGACCAVVSDTLQCIQTQQTSCGFFGGVYEGDGTLCPIPGCSEQCVCDADVEPCGGGDGVLNLADILFLIQCEELQVNPCGGPLLDCDVNCDGLVDFADVGVAILQFQNIPDACSLPVGACCGVVSDTPRCIEVQQSACEGLLVGVYEGDGTLCPIPGCGGPCVCDADVGPCEGPNGLINLEDILILTECMLSQADPCGGPLERCDVNCDGLVNFADIGVATLQFMNVPDACNVPVGACCKQVGGDQEGVRNCIQFQQVLCEDAGGVYDGDGTLCPIPAIELCEIDIDCDDCQSCTVDTCQGGTCIYTPDTRVCCHPVTGKRTLIDDENPCTDDVCDLLTGQVTHVGTAATGVCAAPVGSRHLGITPPCGLAGGCDDATQVAMFLSVEVEPGVMIDLGFIQTDGTIGETPAFDTPASWGTLSLTGGFVRPSTTYVVTLVPMAGLTTGSTSSATTGIYADLDANGVVNFSDIQIGVFVFQGNPLFVALLADVEPCVPNNVITLAGDVFAIVRAFQGETFEAACPLGACCFFPANPNSCGPSGPFGLGELEGECPAPGVWTQGGECGPIGECP